MQHWTSTVSTSSCTSGFLLASNQVHSISTVVSSTNKSACLQHGIRQICWTGEPVLFLIIFFLLNLSNCFPVLDRWSFSCCWYWNGRVLWGYWFCCCRVSKVLAVCNYNIFHKLVKLKLFLVCFFNNCSFFYNVVAMLLNACWYFWWLDNFLLGYFQSLHDCTEDQ